MSGKSTGRVSKSAVEAVVQRADEQAQRFQAAIERQKASIDRLLRHREILVEAIQAHIDSPCGGEIDIFLVALVSVGEEV